MGNGDTGPNTGGMGAYSPAPSMTDALCAEALEKIESPEGAEFDVLVTDIGLPDASGWELIPKARERRPSLRIGVVTGWEGHNAPQEGADFLLRKPIRTSDFLQQVAGEREEATRPGTAGSDA